MWRALIGIAAAAVLVWLALVAALLIGRPGGQRGSPSELAGCMPHDRSR
jgi:hypothetical protein